MTPLTIRSVTARAVDVPLARPIRTALGTIPSAPLVLIDVATDQDVIGRAYIFAYTPVALAPRGRGGGEIGALIAKRLVAPFERQAELDRRFRLVGWQGMIGMAVSGLDMALWDALGRAAGLPVAALLGGAPRARAADYSVGGVDKAAP